MNTRPCKSLPRSSQHTSPAPSYLQTCASLSWLSTLLFPTSDLKVREQDARLSFRDALKIHFFDFFLIEKNRNVE